MANNTTLNTNVTSGDVIATEDIAGVKHELVKVEFGADGVATKVSAADPLPVTTDGLTDAELRATPVPVSGTVTVDTSTLATSAKQDTGNSSLSSILAKIITAPATEAKQDIGNSSLASIAAEDFATQTTLALIKAKTDNIDVALSTRTKPADQQHVIVDSGTVTVDTTGLATSAKQDTGNASLSSIDGKLTNPLPVSGTVSTGGLTDTQLRATPVPISGTVTTTATDLDIRNLVFATDKVDASGTVLGAGSAVIGHVITDSGSTTAVTGTVTTTQAAPTTILNGKTTVTTAGTRVTLAASTVCVSVTIKALAANTGIIYVGNSSVASTNGFALKAGEAISMDISNLNTVNLDCSVNGEGVTYLAVN